MRLSMKPGQENEERKRISALKGSPLSRSQIHQESINLKKNISTTRETQQMLQGAIESISLACRILDN
jgi:hypothetical protein